MIDPMKPVRVYRNLQRKCYSVQQSGKVVAHVNQIALKDCTFIVQPAGRDRVRREGRKNVHAFIRGYLDNFDWLPKAKAAMYDPYKFDNFVDGMTWATVSRADKVLLNESGVFYTRR